MHAFLPFGILKKINLHLLFELPQFYQTTNATDSPPPPPTSPPSSWRQVAALLDFTIGRHSQSGRVGKDFSHPCGHCAWVPFFNTELNIQTILGFASYLHHPHKTLAKQRSQQAQRIQEKKNHQALHMSVHVQTYVHLCLCVRERELEGICCTSGVCVPHSSKPDIKLRREM